MATQITLTFSDALIARHIASCLPVDIDENKEPIMAEGAWAKLQAVKDIKRGIHKREKRKIDIAQSKAVVAITDEDLIVE